MALLSKLYSHSNKAFRDDIEFKIMNKHGAQKTQESGKLVSQKNR